MLHRSSPALLVPALGLLTSLFAVRVLAQLLQAVSPINLLPPFEAWQGSKLPYPALLSTQILILAAMVWIVIRCQQGGRVLPEGWVGPIRTVAALYFGIMAVRLAGGLTVLAQIPWFAAYLPAAFHLVLATFLFVLSSANLNYGSKRETRLYAASSLGRVAAYPGVLAVAFIIYPAIQTLGLGPEAAAMITVAAAAAAITLLERWMPYRKAWRPGMRDVVNDTAFMGLVQVLLPRLLTFALVVGVASRIAGTESGLGSIWPHDWNIPGQAILMLVSADFLRYWLHRAAHAAPMLWRFHAVHHAPRHLYWLNVGRFHPLEKAVQFGLDSAPFMLLGVSTEVISLYFVFFAINGFYQHSNCDIRLGPLNYLISGPELHRWHHSQIVAESNRNYGNNLILWDLLFGTRFLPSDRDVGVLGLTNTNYPVDFLGQMRSPFVPNRNPSS